MANQEQVDRLLQGIKGWNIWRVEHDTDSIDLSNVNLSNADLRGANLRGTDFSRDGLTSADFTNAGFILVPIGIHANLSGANLNGANLSNADLDFTDLSDANLSGANLCGAYLSNADLKDAMLIGSHIGWTTFRNLDLRTVQGLETVIHDGPSTIGTDTILRSEGDIPEVFLRGAGLSDTFIEYVRSLAQQPIKYYTCFISYSSQDKAFAKRLYADLQNSNMRCWFAPHDLRIGDEIRSRIDESIRIHDKLLLVLSQHSIESAWVKKEVETAFEKEQHQGKLVLFPVKLDNTVMDTNKSWAADIRRMRHIGDFQHWKEHDEYEQAFTRLLRDLKAESNT